MLCEAISMATALGAVEKQVAMLESLRWSRYSPQKHAERVASENPRFADPNLVAIIDAKLVYDATHSEQAQGEDDRSALEIAVIKESLAKMQGTASTRRTC